MRPARPSRFILIVAVSGLVLACTSSVSASAERVPASSSRDPGSIRRTSPLLGMSAQLVERQGLITRKGGDRVLCDIHPTAWRTSMRPFLVAATSSRDDLLSPSASSSAQRAPPLNR